MNHRVLIVGGRSKAKSLALSLLKRKYDVTVVNASYDDCMYLAEVDKLVVIHGDGSKPYVLDDAHASDCDIAIALTKKDEDNLVICELCKKRFKVKKTVALVSDPRKMDLFYQLGIDRVVCAISAVTSIIEQQTIIDDITEIVPIVDGRIKIAQIQVSDSSPVAGKQVCQISLPKEVIIGCVLRGETTMIPRGDTWILSGDVLVLIGGNGQEIAAIKTLTGR